ncbi:MAG TPA: glycoside hydrolase family 3 N-terminal domain-containing protein [Patescibacteria group bacterium]|nr:glycoside hydrolase family 3 N-terminal domain-containing protein [Patescibacteria group bacterium]
MATTEIRYRDPGLPIDGRVADLLTRMTLGEKVAQLGSVWSFELIGSGGLDRVRARELIGAGIGQITRVAGATNFGAADVLRVGNEIQRYLVEETRLGIPAIIHEETLHGLLARDAPSFQQAIGMAAAWDAELVEAMATTIRRRMLATGARHALAPILDIGRDPRWGRIEETFGEDPYLAAELGCAYTRGLQGSGLIDGVAATGKHMVGHGLAEGGLNQAPAHLGPRELRDEQLFPFEAAVREAGLATMMPAYGDVDGLPCHASHELLTAILRDEWGFDGIVASDYVALRLLSTQHLLTPSLATAAVMALEAGVDVELPSSLVYAVPLMEAVATGGVSEASVDRAVGRVLRLKFELGLFERPVVDPPSGVAMAELSAVESLVADELARRSLVLVENDGVLPLRTDLGRVAVVGPIAASARDLLGDYHHLLHIETLAEMRNKPNAFGFPLDARIDPADELAGLPTILDAITERLGETKVDHARGTGLRDGTDAEIAEAVDIARRADVAIVVLGERSGLTEDATSGESRDRSDLGFLGRQQELLEAVVATGTPVVLVVVSGRPLAIDWAARNCAAVVLAWVPGPAGPAALADVLTGDVNPGGKLPISFPRHVGQVPVSYRHHPTGGRSNWKGPYVDGPTTPLWPFGHGRSYTTFALSRLELDRTELATDAGELRVSVDVANVGTRAGDEVVQLYARDEEATVARPVLELRGFRRVSLAPGERRTVTFELSAEQFAYVGADLRRVIEPGRIHLWIGTSAADLPLEADVDLVGSTVHLVERQRYLTRTDLS